MPPRLSLFFFFLFFFSFFFPLFPVLHSSHLPQEAAPVKHGHLQFSEDFDQSWPENFEET
ncbi:hypothetical protein ACP275_06G142100 [Erythranthe tilingii]